MTPKQMFGLAAKKGRSTIVELSKLCRECGVKHASELRLKAPIFLNTHPAEDLFDDVLPQLLKLRQQLGGNRWVLELHEDITLTTNELVELGDRLEALDIEIALDDVGSGRDRTNVICQCKIGFIKLCKNLIQENAITLAFAEFASFVHSSGATVIAEGVETRDEVFRCRELGIELAQGYYYGKPRLVLAQ